MKMNLTQETKSLSTNLSSLAPLEGQQTSYDEAEKPILELVARLCKVLEQENINYCHWKSNLAIDQAASGEDDLDLLVDRADIQRFIEILDRLRFKEAKSPVQQQTSGVFHYYGYDETFDKFVHVHAYSQLVFGHDRTENYRLPIEVPFLASATQTNLFRLPSLEFEFIVLVIRRVLEYSTWDVILTGMGKVPASSKSELENLLRRVDWIQIADNLRQYLPYLNESLFAACVQSIQSDCPVWKRIWVGHQLQKTLQACARRPHLVDISLKLWRRVSRGIHRRVLGDLPKKRLSRGGCIVAILGGDGAGKSTAVSAIDTWLSKNFDTLSIHLGKPRKSRTTIAVRLLLKGFQVLSSPFRHSSVSPDYAQILRQLCTTRDRYLTYLRMRRFSTNGGLVICDRFPMAEIKLMDAPQIEQMVAEEERNGFVNWAIALEQHWYQYMTPPELLIVLKLDPEIAVLRKTDEKPEHVRPRSTEIWELDWEDKGVFVVDASKSKAETIAQLKSRIWSAL
jgi:thymidylate kinase